MSKTTFSIFEFLFLFYAFASRTNAADICNRNCTADPAPKTCAFNFKLENYLTMSSACSSCPFNISSCYLPQCIPGNGIQRKVTVVNRSLPGPSIQACLGDTLRVTVVNMLDSQSTSIHWHGIKQISSQYMDGVPMVTQCPIQPFDTFVYQFQLQQAGTYFWHGHSGLQRADGVFGSLIVRSPNDQMSFLYDRDEPDHVITLNDWMSLSSDSAFVYHVQSNGSNHPQSILVNGHGRFKPFFTSDNNSTRVVYTPLHIFRVQRGLRYRFRLIYSGVFNCPLQISVDSHRLLVIAGDGADFEPVSFDSLIINSGERFDFVLNANQNVSNYKIKIRGLLDCDQRFTSAFQMAELRYVGAEETDLASEDFSYEDTNTFGQIFNPINMKSNNYLKSLEPDNVNISRLPDAQFYLAFDFYYINNPLYSHSRQLPLINHVYMQFPPSPLLSQFNDVPLNIICDSPINTTECSKTFCECLHLLRVPLNSLVEMVLVDEGFAFNFTVTHPMHLHGYSFNVVAMEKIGYNATVEEVKRLDSQGKIKRIFDRPILKDTVEIPSGGYVIVRFIANNPGFWLLHCHYEFHLEMGMNAILQVGQISDYSDPPYKFPKCNNWN